MDSILTSVRGSLGPTEEYTHFDPQIIMHINSVFADLSQMGVGPDGFFIEDDTTTWSDYLPVGSTLEAVKSYMYLRVRLLFDPPLNSAHIAAMQRDIDRWEFRLNVAAESE